MRNLFMTAIFLSACAAGGEAAQTPVTRPVAEQPIVHRGVRGVVVTSGYDGFSPESAALVVDHEAIGGYMDAMRMSLVLTNPAELKGLRYGDKIRFDMIQDGNEFLIQNIERLPHTVKLSLRGVELLVPIPFERPSEAVALEEEEAARMLAR